MKKPLIIALLFYPLTLGFSQTTKVEPPSSKAEAAIKERIAANMDTALLNIVNAKVVVLKKPVPKPPKYSTKTKIITVYVDTCLSDKTQFIYFEKIPETIEVPEITTQKKLKWYQFRAIKKEKKLKGFNQLN